MTDQLCLHSISKIYLHESIIVLIRENPIFAQTNRTLEDDKKLQWKQGAAQLLHHDVPQNVSSMVHQAPRPRNDSVKTSDWGILQLRRFASKWKHTKLTKSNTCNFLSLSKKEGMSSFEQKICCLRNQRLFPSGQ